MSQAIGNELLELWSRAKLPVRPTVSADDTTACLPESSELLVLRSRVKLPEWSDNTARCLLPVSDGQFEPIMPSLFHVALRRTPVPMAMRKKGSVERDRRPAFGECSSMYRGEAARGESASVMTLKVLEVLILLG